jgi:hypothetical protein
LVEVTYQIFPPKKVGVKLTKAVWLQALDLVALRAKNLQIMVYILVKK